MWYCDHIDIFRNLEYDDYHILSDIIGKHNVRKLINHDISTRDRVISIYDNFTPAVPKIQRIKKGTYMRYVSTITRIEAVKLPNYQLRESSLRWCDHGFDPEIDYQIDHKISKIYGYKNNINPADIGHVSNLRIIKALDNYRKGITYVISILIISGLPISIIYHRKSNMLIYLTIWYLIPYICGATKRLNICQIVIILIGLSGLYIIGILLTHLMLNSQRSYLLF